LHAPAKRFQFLRVVGLIDPLVGRKLGRDNGPASIVSKPAHPVPGARPPDEPSGLSWDEASTLVDEATACLWGPGGGTALSGMPLTASGRERPPDSDACKQAPRSWVS